MPDHTHVHSKNDVEQNVASQNELNNQNKLDLEQRHLFLCWKIIWSAKSLRPAFDPELLPMGLGVVPLETLKPSTMLIVVKAVIAS